MKHAIGIDLGTTNCCVAYLKNGRPKVIEDDKGYNIIPSYIGVKDNNSLIVGHAAKSQAVVNPENTIRAFKRIIGRKIDSLEVEEAIKRLGYRPVIDSNKDIKLQIGNMEISPIEASSILLKKIKEIAEQQIGGEVESAVITCPAYFTNSQRKATLEAAEKSGLKVLRLLNEPTAAALAFGYRKDIKKRILIYDLGGGTFDVSILQVGSNVYEVLGSHGDPYLGGEDFDQCIIDYLSAQFKTQHNVDLRSDLWTLQRLKDASERAKIELSSLDRTEILIPHIHGTNNLQIRITRHMFEEMTEHLVKRTFNVINQTLKDVGLSVSDINEVILVGGQTRMPRIQENIKSFFGKAPSKGVHPDEAVAIGAAVHAVALLEEKQDIVLLDVTPFSLGIDNAGGVFTEVLKKNAKIPAIKTQTFTTASDNQESVKIVIRQGNSKIADENILLGEFELGGIRPAPRMEPKIEVSFKLDVNGILNVSAKDKLTGQKQSIEIKDITEKARESNSSKSPQGNTQNEKEEQIEQTPTSLSSKASSFFKKITGIGKNQKVPSLGLSENLAPVERTKATSVVIKSDEEISSIEDTNTTIEREAISNEYTKPIVSTHSNNTIIVDPFAETLDNPSTVINASISANAGIVNPWQNDSSDETEESFEFEPESQSQLNQEDASTEYMDDPFARVATQLLEKRYQTQDFDTVIDRDSKETSVRAKTAIKQTTHSYSANSQSLPFATEQSSSAFDIYSSSQPSDPFGILPIEDAKQYNNAKQPKEQSNQNETDFNFLKPPVDTAFIEKNANFNNDESDLPADPLMEALSQSISKNISKQTEKQSYNDPFSESIKKETIAQISTQNTISNDKYSIDPFERVKNETANNLGEQYNLPNTSTNNKIAEEDDFDTISKKIMQGNTNQKQFQQEGFAQNQQPSYNQTNIPAPISGLPPLPNIQTGQADLPQMNYAQNSTINPNSKQENRYTIEDNNNIQKQYNTDLQNNYQPLNQSDPIGTALKNIDINYESESLENEINSALDENHVALQDHKRTEIFTAKMTLPSQDTSSAKTIFSTDVLAPSFDDFFDDWNTLPDMITKIEKGAVKTSDVIKKTGNQEQPPQKYSQSSVATVSKTNTGNFQSFESFLANDKKEPSAGTTNQFQTTSNNSHIVQPSMQTPMQSPPPPPTPPITTQSSYNTVADRMQSSGTLANTNLPNMNYANVDTKQEALKQHNQHNQNIQTEHTPPKKKPARLKMAYKTVPAFLSEYKENMARGGTFIKTPNPLQTGRECLFEFIIPTRSEPLLLKGVVVSNILEPSNGQEAGMNIRYIFDEEITKSSIEEAVNKLK